MLTRRAAASLLFAAPAVSAARAEPAPRSAALRRDEVVALRAFAETTHPRGREAAADPLWRAHWDDLALRADRLADGLYVAGLLRGVGWFKDGHSTILPFDFVGGVPEAMKTGPFGMQPPLRARAFHDGLYVTDAKGDAVPLLGTRITAVNGVSDVELMRRFVDLWPGNNSNWGHRWAGNLFSSAGYLEGLGVLTGPGAPLQVEARAADGRALSARLAFTPDGAKDRQALPRLRTTREAWAELHKGGNYVHPLPDRRALYVSIDEMGDIEGRSFSQLTRDLFTAMAAPEVDRIVIDLSRNGGGDNFWGEPLRKGLERSRFNRPGGLYVIISPVTFSAAQNLTNRLERETYAVFVGEPTGGAPNHYGDAKIFKGEATGVTAMISTIPWFDSYPMDRRAMVSPDLPAPALYADWKAGHFPALEAALSQRTNAEPNDLSVARTFYFRRASQAVAWKPFWIS